MLFTRDELWAEHILTQWAVWVDSSLGLGYSSTKKLPPLVDQTLTEAQLLQVDRCVAQMREWQRRLVTRYYRLGLHVTEAQRKVIYRALRELWIDIWGDWPDWDTEQRLSLGITQRPASEPATAPAKAARGGARKGAGRPSLIALGLKWRALGRVVLGLRKNKLTKSF